MRVVHPKLQRNHVGLDGFIWAIGVVEDRFDPLELGRCKVRYMGWHTSNKDEMPTDKLPWSYALLELDNMKNVVGPKEGDWVVGFFRDGIIAQEPVIIGIVPGIPEIEANPSQGFNDPRADKILSGHNVPREPDKLQQYDDGSGNDIHEQLKKSRYPDKNYLKDPDSSAYSRGDIDKTVVPIKMSNIDIGQRNIPTAGHPAGTGTDINSPEGEFSEEETPFQPKYPYNHAFLSESGHLKEIDDTPGSERLHWYHRSGSFEEIHPSGLVVRKIVDHFYQIVLRTFFQHIESFALWTIDKGMKLFVNKDGEIGNNFDATIGPGADFNVTIQDGKLNVHVITKDANIKVGRDGIIEIDKNLNIIVHDNANIRIDGDANLDIKGDYKYNIDGDVTGVIRGNKTEYILGRSTQIVAFTASRLAGLHLVDYAIGQAQRVSLKIDDFAFTINHNARITNCSGILTGLTTGVPGPEGDPLRAITTLLSMFAGTFVDSFTSGAQENINKTWDNIHKTAEMDALEASLAPTGFTGTGESSSTGAASGPGSSGSGSGSGSGSSQPSEKVEDAPLGFLWKPYSDSTGKLVVLIPTPSSCSITTQDGQTEIGQYAGIANGNRAHYRFSRHGSGYGQNATVKFSGYTILIPDGSKRYEGV